MNLKFVLTALMVILLSISNSLFADTLNDEETEPSILEKLIEEKENVKIEDIEKELNMPEEYEMGYQKGYEEAIKLLGYHKAYREGYEAAKREKLEYERGYEEGYNQGYEDGIIDWKKKSYSRGMKRGILNTAIFFTPCLIFLLASRGD